MHVLERSIPALEGSKAINGVSAQSYQDERLEQHFAWLIVCRDISLNTSNTMQILPEVELAYYYCKHIASTSHEPCILSH